MRPLSGPAGGALGVRGGLPLQVDELVDDFLLARVAGPERGGKIHVMPAS